MVCSRLGGEVFEPGGLGVVLLDWGGWCLSLKRSGECMT